VPQRTTVCNESAAHELRGVLGPPGPRLAALALTAVVGISVAYIAGIVVPYFVNDLHHLPLTEVRGGVHDPKDLWSSTAGPVGELLHATGPGAGHSPPGLWTKFGAARG
jgi:hypothetical protein